VQDGVGVSSPHFNDDADEVLVAVDGASGFVHFVTVENTDAADTVYLQLFGDPDAVVGTDPPLQSYACPPGSTGFFFGDRGLVLGSSGVHYAVTAGRTSAVAPPSAVSLNMGYS
jgi:hypothetical protein